VGATVLGVMPLGEIPMGAAVRWGRYRWGCLSHLWVEPRIAVHRDWLVVGSVVAALGPRIGELPALRVVAANQT